MEDNIMNTLQITQFIANIAVTVTFIAIFIQSFIALRTYRDSIKQKKRDRTLIIINKWNQLDFAALRRSVMLYFNKLQDKTIEGIGSKVETDYEIRGKVCFILNVLEEIAVGINRNIIDFDITYGFFQPVATFYFEMLHPFVNWQQKTYQDDSVFIEVERMYQLFIQKNSEKYSIPPGRYWRV
ncbi:MAG: DUF4760 domain-containing protein [Bacteroidales bacterium]|nr:DUF4760 domain-containing protein [Bacteroidales bacterium]